MKVLLLACVLFAAVAPVAAGERDAAAAEETRVAVLEEEGAASCEPAGCEPLVELMVGSFSSAEQAQADTAYYDIRLEMVRIWPERTDAHWMYIEQAVAGHTDAPYRQRVYRVTQVEDDLYRSEVFALPDPKSVVGEWLSRDPLSDLTPDDLIPRAGCAVYLRRDECGEYAGATIGKGCASSIGEAAYATSEVLVGPDRIESWDRGFDAEGNQVWGAEKGPYVFLRDGVDKARGTIPRFDEQKQAE